jgi:hypothetical protein
MPTYTYPTKELSINNAKAFIAAVNETDTVSVKKSAILYACIGNSNVWSDEPNPSEPERNIATKHFKVKREMVGAKRITPADVSHVVTRHNWVSGTIYAMYKHTTIDPFDPTKQPFYVVTDQLNIYKCLNNNSGAVSTVKPTGFSTLPFTASDGYTWKYMYTVSLGDSDKFMTSTHMPVKTITASDTSTESDRLLAVQNAAVDGAIQVIEVNTIGVDYEEVFDAPVSTATTLTLTVSPSSEISIDTGDDIYNGSSVYVTSGTGSGQLRRITDYNGSTRTLSVNTAFTTIPASDSKIIISPTVTIIGDGNGALAYSRLADDLSGSVASIELINIGTKYTQAEALVTANPSHGSGATANVIISPMGGHGSDPVRELGGDKVGLNVLFKDVEGVSATGAGYIPVGTTFRTVSVLKDPILKVDENNVALADGTEVVAKSINSPATLRLTTRASISYESIADDIPINPLVAGQSITNERNRSKAALGTLEFVTDLSEVDRNNNAMANALKAANANIVLIKDDETKSDTSFYTLYLNNVNSYGNYTPFVKDDFILKAGSDATTIASIEDITGPEANTFSGEILYTENISTVDRTTDQTEDIKIILDF